MEPAPEPKQEATDVTGTFEVFVTNILSGAEVGTFVLPANATLASLKMSIAKVGGPQIAQQRIVHGMTFLFNESLPLKDLRQEGSSEQDSMSFSVGRLQRRNLALASTGASMVGEWGEGQNGDRKPLLRFDDAFPDVDGDPSGSQLGEVVSGSDLGNHLKKMDAGWSGDCQVSTFLQDDGEVTVFIPGEDNHFEKIGFTYSPWDRNYGSTCSVLLSNSGPEGPWETVGSIAVPQGGRDRGNSAHNSAKTLYLDVPQEHAEASYNHMKLSFGTRGAGRRLFFVYAFGY